MVPAGEPGHGDDVADHGGGDDRPGAGHLGKAGAGCRDRGGQLLADLAPLGVQVAEVGQQLGGELAARLGNRTGRGHFSPPPPPPPLFFSHSTASSRQTTWLRVRERSRWRLARTFSTTAWPSAVTSWRLLDRNAATATDRASFGSVLFVSPASSSRTRAASLGCTSSTRSPAATSCRASSRPSPRAPSTVQVRSGEACAQVTSFPAWSGQARTRLPSRYPANAATSSSCCWPMSRWS